MRIGLLHAHLRAEEKLLIQKAQELGITLVRVDERSLALGALPEIDVLIDRSVTLAKPLRVLHAAQHQGIKTINSFSCALTCSDKAYTSQVLAAHNIPQPRYQVALSEEAALRAAQELGYPLVLKPLIGSWGRLITKITDQEALTGVLEHKMTLGHYEHQLVYLQEYIEKPHNRDIRAFVVGEEVICAIYRTSTHWKTNTALGATASNCEVTPKLRELCLSAARAVGADIVAIDLFETNTGALLVNEINHTMEFRNSITTTGVDIPQKILEYARRA